MDLSKIFESLAEVLTTVSDGGPKAIITILAIFVVIVIFANYLIIKFIIRFFERMTEARDTIVKEKDDIIQKRMDRVEELSQQYNQMQRETIGVQRDTNSALAKMEIALHDLNSNVQNTFNALISRMK